MKYRVLFSIFLIIISFIFINRYKAKSTSCNLYKKYKDISTLNFLDKFSLNESKNILKICTNDICTYSLDEDYKGMLIEHKNKIINKTRNEDIKIEIDLKGIKIDTIHFKDCI